MVAAMVALAVTGAAGAAELAYAERTSTLSVTATTLAGSDTLVSSGSLTYAAEKICVEFGAQGVSIGGSPGGFAWFTLWDGATDLGSLAYMTNASSGTTQTMPLYGKRCFTPTAGSHEYIVKVYKAQTVSVLAGNPSAGSTAYPAFVRVTNESAGGSGAEALDDLTDVEIVSPIDGAVLKYDESDELWQVATDNAGGEGSSGPVTLSAGDRDRLDLAWWGVWALVGLALLALIAPAMYRLLDVRHGLGGRFERG